MDVWSWSSPVGWAVFLVACGVTVAVASWGLRVLSEAVERFVALDAKTKE